MNYMGIGDEGANTIDGQIRATQELGWKYLEPRGVEVPGFTKANLHDIPDPAFDVVVRKLETARVGAYCFGSTIMNWSKKVGDPFEPTLAEVKRAIPRMQRLGSKYIRIMSFKPGDEEFSIPAEVFRRVKEVTNRFLDAGIQPVHENCMNYGGMSWQHGLELLTRAALSTRGAQKQILISLIRQVSWSTKSPSPLSAGSFVVFIVTNFFVIVLFA